MEASLVSVTDSNKIAVSLALCSKSNEQTRRHTNIKESKNFKHKINRRQLRWKLTENDIQRVLKAEPSQTINKG